MNPLTIALPSKGAIAEPTLSFLKDAGLKVYKPNDRQYTGSIPAVPNLGVLFQRVKDIVYKVSDGTAQLGITGLDVVCENPHDDLIVIHDKLGYGHCKLVVAVPEAWADVQTIMDLTELAHEFREQKGRNIRIATTYPQLTRQFLYKNQLHYFTLVRAEGAIEAAPTIGYADFVVDLTQTGTTLRENHLRIIEDGTIVEAQACLIGNRTALQRNPQLRDAVQILLEHIDAAIRGRDYYQITADIQGESAEAIAKKLSLHPATHGLLGPTIAPIYQPTTSASGSWFTITLTVSQKDLLSAVGYLREVGGTHALVTPIKYLFLHESLTYQRLREKLDNDSGS